MTRRLDASSSRAQGKSRLDQPLAAQAHEPLGSDDDVIVHRDSHLLACLHHGARQVDIGAARAGIARGMVVDQPRRMR